MSRTVSTDFIDAKNSQTNQPRWLYEIETDSVILYLTNGPSDITYDGQLYKGQPAGGAPGGTIEHQGLSENITGRMDNVKLSVGNVDQIFQAYLESEDGLRGKTVTIRLVFADDLSNDESQIVWDFTIDYSTASSETIVFDLVWQNDPLSRMFPTQLMDRETFPNSPSPFEVFAQ